MSRACFRSPRCGRPALGPCRPSLIVPGRGRPTKQLRRDAKHRPVKVKDLTISLPSKAWRTITWREGTNAPLKSRFARSPIRIAHRDFDRSQPWPEEWLLIEWPKGEQEPTKYWLSTLPESIGFVRLVDLTKLRWRIERDYQELKQDVGLDTLRGAAGAAIPSSASWHSRVKESHQIGTSLPHRVSMLVTETPANLRPQRVSQAVAIASLPTSATARAMSSRTQTIRRKLR